jgi:hypothetical protein
MDNGKLQIIGLRSRARRFALALALLALSILNYPFSNVEAAVGDTTADCQSIAAAASLSVKPGAGVEWIIHNIWFEYNVQILRTDGTDTAATVELIGPDWQNFLSIHVTNTNWIDLKNTHGSTAKVICYDGIITK